MTNKAASILTRDGVKVDDAHLVNCVVVEDALLRSKGQDGFVITCRRER